MSNVVSNEQRKDAGVKKKLEELSPPGSSYNLFQLLLQELQATDIIDSASVGQEKTPPLTKQLDRLRLYIKDTYECDEDVRDILLDYFPNYTTIKYWVDKKEWKEEVLKKVKDAASFSHGKRVKVFEAIYKKATENLDMKAAELFCKLSGDLKSSTEGTKESKELQDYNKFNNILHTKK